MIPQHSDIEQRRSALATARILLDSKAVRFDAATPYRFGAMESPLHVDARLVLSWPERRERLLRMALDMLGREAEDTGFDAVACCTEGQAIPFATLIADRMELPLIFVRRAGGGDPHKPPLEGHVERGWRVLMVEQLAADGQRKSALIRPLLEAGAVVSDLLVLFQYGVFDDIHDHLAPLGVRLHALATWWDIRDEATEGGDLVAEALAEVDRFLKDPRHWHPPEAG